MGKRLMALCVAAVLVVPMAGVMAAPPIQAPPGLLNAKDKIAAAIQRQIDKENAKYDEQSAALLDAIAEVEPWADLGDPAAQEELDALNAQLQKLSDKHDQKIKKLEDRQDAKVKKFKDKVAAWQEKHGTPDPSVPPPPPEPDGDPPQ